MTTAPVDWMVEDYLEALDRLLRETPKGDAGAKETFLPLFEALNWAASIDKFFDDSGNPIQDDLLTAVRFARNRVHHQWGLALRRYDSPGIPMVIQAPTTSSRPIGVPAGFWWSWVKAGDLPIGDHPWPRGETAYAAQLAEKQADATLKALKPVLEALA